MRFENGGLRGRMVLGLVSWMKEDGGRRERRWEPFRTNITPDQRVGSPGVRLMNTPWGQAYLRLEL